MRNKLDIVMFFVLLLVTLTATAQDVSVRGCRRGVQRGGVTRGLCAADDNIKVGGDFYHGDRHQLVVLASFSDWQFEDDESATMQKWDKIFNAVGYSEAPFVGSVHDYFYAQSYQQFYLTFDLQYVQLSEGRSRYASNSVDDENSQYLVNDIMDVLSTRDIDWSLYDWNGDGYVNQLLIVYAGKGMNDGGGSNTIWPHQWWLSLHVDPTTEAYCQPRTVTNDDGTQYTVDSYCAVQEEGNHSASFGTICHEFSHCFGFPDFYYGTTMYLKDWEIMDYGNCNGGGYRPANYSAHERWLMGWLTPVELTSTTTISDMPALSDQPQAYLVRNDGCEQEYYLLENRQQKDWDTSLPGNGIVVFHIHFDKEIWGDPFASPNTPSEKHYLIIPANNKSATYYSNGWAYPYQANDSLTNNSKPEATLWNANSDGTKLMNKSLHDIKVENGLASFRFTVDQSTGIDELETEGEPRELYRIGPVSILRYPNGEIKKVMKR
ncbi:MAG: M6 family metalloprotease domain-containing protein [Prevotella sp.]|nr:M6 family metalloprotease domain-containing protein [Prevotella sp.]